MVALLLAAIWRFVGDVVTNTRSILSFERQQGQLERTPIYG